MRMSTADAMNEITLTIEVYTPKLTSFRMWFGLKLMRVAGWVLPYKVEMK
jgi:hypothetical protein